MSAVGTEQVQSRDAAPVRRRAERWIAGIGMAGAAVLQGGFVLVVTRSDEATLQSTIVPGLRAAGLNFAAGDAEVILGTLAGWFGFSLILTALLCAIGFFFAAHRPRRRRTGWWFLAAGLVCLFGTQLILYPIAFFFFLSAALFAVRPPHPRSST
ncbi:hypothetical protein ET475_03095 [Microbacterium protaetiae]|uniref:DUF4064 domain-containing protein n=1 Tax=Microbacterium protaetiae TaxID=2509458 RepID=A0A4P6EG14_9MICO|nr:hypothetical protein [Microbacterium protaetiae]QAY59077.1 hypothetical protein ET475_03095 [Microbacterium protaetiae]